MLALFLSAGITSPLFAAINTPGADAFSQVTTSEIQANWTDGGNPPGTSYTVILSTRAFPSTNDLSGNISSDTLNTSVLFSGLDPNTTYYAEVNATDGIDISTFTNLGSVRTDANAPISAGLTNVSSSQLRANWAANGNPLGTIYTVILSTGSSPSANGIPGNRTLFTANTFVTFTSLSPNTFYFAEVQAAASTFTDLGSTSTLANLPTTANPSAVQPTQLTANWNSNGNPAGTTYRVQLSTTSAFSLVTPLVTANSFATFTGLIGGTTYFMRVQAMNNGGTPTAFIALPSTVTPTNLPLSAAFSNVLTSQLQANWTVNGNPPGTVYTVILSSGSQPSTNNFPGNITIPTTNPFAVFTGLAVNRIFFAAVKAGASAYVDLGSTSTLANFPVSAGPPAVQSSQLTANWSPNGNPTGTTYLAQLSTDAGFSTIVDSSSTFTISATFTGLFPNTTYFTRVGAVNHSGIATNFSNLPSIVTLVNAPGISPFSNIGPTQLQANWTTNGNPAGTFYTATISTGASPSTNGFSGNTSSVTTNTSVLFAGLSPGTVYFVDVKAANAAGNSTLPTALGSAQTTANSPVPAAYSNVTPSQLQGNWNANGNPPGTLYTAILSSAISPSTNGLSGNVTVNTVNTFALFTGLNANSIYFIDVKAGGSPYVSLGSTTTLVTTPGSANPTNIQITQFTANWIANGNPAGTTYLVQLSTDSGFGSFTGNSTLNTSFTFTGLTTNTTYYTRVQAINAAGAGSAFVNLPSIITLANPPGASPLSNITATQIQANWTANGNPAGTTYVALLSTGPSPSTNGFSGNINSTTFNTNTVFTGLAVNTIYFAEVKAVSQGGVPTAFTVLGFASTLANAPVSAAPSAIGINQITAQWTPNSNPAGTSYVVQASTEVTFASLAAAVTTTGSSATLTGLAANTQYFMRVQAVNQTGTGTPFTALPSATTLQNIPNAPNPAAFNNVTATQLTANWTANGNPPSTNYSAILSSGPSPSTNNLAGNQTLAASTTSVTFSGLSPNKLYFVEVRATSTGGSSTYATLGSVATLANAPTAAGPTNIGINQITANWGTNGNPAGTTYLIQASVDSGFSSFAVSQTVTASSFTLTGLAAGTPYFMRVQAINQSSIGTPFTALPSASTLEAIPNAPGAASFSNVTSNQLQAAWTANGNPPTTSYRAILSTAPSPGTNNLPSNQTTITANLFAIFTSLIPNTLYYVDVQGSSSGGSSAFSSLGSVPTLANPPTSAAPTNIGINQITAHWGANGNPAGTTYLVQASTDAAFGTLSAAVSTTASSMTLTGLAANTVYFMRVQAINLNSVGTSFTGLPSATTLENVPNPPGVAAFNGVATTQLQAAWTANGNPPTTSYRAILSTAPSPSTNNLPSNQTTVTTNLSATFTGLIPNTLYYVDVNGSSSGGSSAYSSLGSVPTLANAPTPGSPTNVQQNRITANWGANSNAAGTLYLVQASLDSTFTSITVAVSTTSVFAILTGLSPSTSYYMRVQAINQGGLTTVFTGLPLATTLINLPNSPASAGFTGIGVTLLTANWGANGNPAGMSYTAVLSTVASPSTNGLSGNKSINTTNLSAPFTGLAPNTLYFVEVNAANAAGNSPYTNLGSAPTLANVPAPGNPTAIGTNQITANWNVNGNPAGTSYLAQASPDSGFSSITSAVTTANSSATLTGLLAQTTYFMRVQAFNQIGVQTSFVLLPQAQTLTIPPNVPGAAGFTGINITQLTANWTANGNPAGTSYTAVLSTAPSPSTNGLAANKTINTTNLAAPFTALAPNTLYYVQVKAASSGGNSTYTSLGSVPTLANPPTPAAPTAIGTNQITATWGTNGNPPILTSYLVQASPDSGFSSITSAVTTTNSSATLTGLLAQTTYFMRVQASNQIGTQTAFVLLPQAQTLTTPPNVPGASGSTSIGITQLTVSWTANGNPAGTFYNALLSTAPFPSTNGLAGNKSITTTNLTAPFTGLNPNTLYYVEVNATSSGGSSAYTVLGFFSTLANPPTSGNPTAIGTNQITANWNVNGNPAGVTTYLVQASPDAEFSSITSAVNTTNSSATLTGLLPQTIYFMQVRAFNQTGIPTAFVPLPQAQTLTIPPNVPGAAGFTGVATTQLTANWTANGNPAGTSYTAVLSTAPSPSTNGLSGNKSITTTNLFAPFTVLAPNTLYYVQVNAASAGGNSAYTALGSIPTLANPPTPGNPTALGTNQITANWGANGNPAGTLYTVQASPDSGFSSITSAVNTINSSATLTGLLPQTTYFMRVQASNQGGTATAFVLLPQAQTLTTPPNIPGTSSFSGIGITQLTANWTANGNPAGTSYTAVLSTAPSPSTNGLSGNKLINTTNLFAPFTALIPNTLYFVDVNAASAGGNSAYTALGSVPTLANAPTPGNPTAVGTNQITANWNANSNPAGTLYTVQASPDAGFSSITSAVTTVNSSATLTGLLAQTNYFMRVQASNQGGTPTTFVLLPQALTLTTPPGVPGAAGFTGVATTQLTANWTANGNPAGTSYTAVLSTAPSPSTNGLSGNKSITTTNLFAPFTVLAPSTLYYVEVNAASAGGNSANTALGSVPTLANTPTPGNPTAIGTNQITANWNANGNSAGTLYTVQVSPDSGFLSITSAVSTTNSSATVTGLLPQTNYFMRVQASNQAGIPTSFVLLPQAQTLTIPPNVPGASGYTGITITQLTANWTANGNPAGTSYTAVLSTAPSPSTNGLSGNKSITTTNLFAPFTVLVPNTLYFVEVNAASAGGNSAYTSLGSIPTLANTPTPGNPTAIGTNQITANWGANGNPAGTTYTVQVSPDAGFSSITSAVTTVNLSAPLTGLLAQTNYFMRVQASNQGGTPTAFVLLPQAQTLTIPPNFPGASGFTGITITQLAANWTANGNPAGTSYVAVLSTEPSPSTNGLSGNKLINTTNLFAPFTALIPNTLYYVEVNAASAGGNSAYTALGSVPTLANTPTPGNPTAIDTNQITANWGANGNPAGTTYTVQASPDAGFSSITSAVTTVNSSATLTGLLAQTNYFMRVQASNQGGTPTAFVLLPQAQTLTIPPNVPGAAGFTGIATAQLTANWTANGNLAGTSYTAILSTDASPGTNNLAGNKIINTTNLFAPFTVLAPNTLYYVEVNAVSSGGSSAYTALGSVPTLANPPTPGSPTAIGTNQITANWGANGNPALVTTYLVQASPDSGFSSITSAVTTANSSATLTGLLPQTIYFMRVQAFNQGGTSTAFVLLPQTQTLTIPPNVPGAAGFTGIDTTQVTANWTANGNPAGTFYNAVLSTAPFPGTNGLPGNKSITTTNLLAPYTGLAPNTLYYVEVNATSSGGSSAYTALGSVPTLANLPTPGSPTAIGTNQITANWGANGNPALVTTYLVQASPDAGFSSITSAVTTIASSATLTGLLPQTIYFMRVQASNQIGTQTTFVLLPQAQTLTTPPNIPGAAGFSDIGITQLTANWTSNGNPAGTLYNAVLSTAPSPSTNGLAGNKIINTTNLLAPFTVLAPNTLYYVEVNAVSSGGNSTYMALGSVPTLANPPTPGNPTAIGTNQITATWGPNGNPAGTSFLVQASADAGFTSIASAKTTTASSATLNGLLATTLYFMRVQASNQSGLPTLFVFLPSTTTLENPPAVPAGAGFDTITTSQLRALWTANGNPAGTNFTAILSSAPSPSTNGLSGNQSVTTTNTSATFSALSPNTLYYVEVKAANAGGSSAFADLGSVPTLANAPNSANPTAIGPSQVTANWTANGNPNPTTYVVQLSLDPNFAFITAVKSTTSLSAVFTGLTPDTTYYMHVQALNQSQIATSFTPLPAFITLGNPPVAPGPATFSNVTPSQLQANWTQNGNPTGTFYQTVLSTVPSPGTNGLPSNQTTTGNGIFAIFTGLAPNTLYYADVRSSNLNGQSAITGLGQTATLANPPVPGNPAGVGANQITATWGANGNPNGTSYIVQASLDINFVNIAVTNTSTNTSTTLLGLSPNTTYYTQVQAINQSFVGTPFVVLPSTMTLANAPSLPGPLPFSFVNTTQLQINWTANGNPPGTIYTVILSTQPSPSTNRQPGNRTVTTSATSAVYSGLIPNTVYYADVKASNSTGDSAFTSLGSIVTWASIPTSAAPSGIGINQITAHWGSNGNPAGTLYIVQAGLDINFDSLSRVNTSTTTSSLFTGLTTNTTYFMRVQAINSGGVTTLFTILPPAQTVVTAPGGASITASQITDSSITWTWNSIPNAAGYRIITENNVPVSGDLPSNTLEWQEAPLAVNTAYSRRLVAFNASGASTSSLVTAYTLAHQPTGLSAQTIASNFITITWNANGNPLSTQYVAQISQGLGSGQPITVTGVQGTFTDLIGATTYFITIRALNGAGTAAAAGDVLSVTTLPQLEAFHQICPNAASVLAFNGPKGPVRVDIPSGAFIGCIQMTVKIPGTFPDAPSSGSPLMGTGVGIQLANDQGLQPSLKIKMTVPFLTSDITGGRRDQLVLARYDEIHNAWVMLPSTVDPNQNFITAETDHLSLYQIMVALPLADLSGVRVYPNPFRPAVGHQTVKFVNLPAAASVHLYTLLGEQVQSLISDATGVATWDGRNSSGQSVASGVYFAVVESGGAKTTVKVAVQR